MRNILTTIMLIFLCPFLSEASIMQDDLKIKDVFQLYGKNKNVVMVELSQQMLDMYDIMLYKSITIKKDPEALAFIRKCLEVDQNGARKIKEITSDGAVISAYYQISDKNNDVNRFILFKVNQEGLITLVYIEGKLDSDDLISILFTKQ